MSLLPYYSVNTLEAGCDEAGRGCLAGPVFAAAVIWKNNFSHPLLNDSKQLTLKVRNKLRQMIEQDAAAWAVAQVMPAEIDQVNILNASFLAMHRAIAALNVAPALLLIDGNRFTPYSSIPHVCIVKGDNKYQSIAAASILAKTHRDEYMIQLSAQFPQYDWQQNKGYPTQKHRQAIQQFGVTIHHRRSFKLESE
ncbi:MAG: ribonuclease HII [Saprospiraceae bacterium]|nr:ribonuclease HII [Saprospiraceae bacterium]